MKLKISSKIFEKFAGLNIGVVVGRGIINTGPGEKILALMQGIQEEIREKLDMEILSQLPRIQSWRNAYASFGAKPKKHKSSVESLYRMVLKNVDLRHINNVVDIYNYISLKHVIPVGGDDLSRVEGNISLRFADGSKPFTPLNSDEKATVKNGEVIYADDKEVLCRRWNWRECNKTKMTEDTTDIILLAEGLPPMTEEDGRVVIDDLSGMIKKYCGGETMVQMLSESKQEIEI
ncbi:B3/4 domain-containing protein [Acidobacteriota bacterium]